MGHLFGTTVISTALFTFGWSVSFALTFLDQVHPFPDDMLSFVEKFELGLIYLDAAVCAFVLAFSAVRLCKYVLR
jgi:hypothetical protein